MNLNDYPLWTALITPMKENSEVDYQDLEKLVRSQENAGIGLLVLGSTGEALNLDEEERRKILDFVLALRPKTPVMVGVGGINLKETQAWLKYLESKEGIHCYLMVTPLYARPGDQGQYQWFKSLMDLSSRPVMLYNVPGRTGTALSFKAVEQLSSHPQFWAIKEASGSPEKFANYVAAASGGRVYSGDDAMLPDYTKLQAKGLVSVAGNVWPQETRLYVDQNLSGHFKESDIAIWKKSSNALFCASNPIAVKALMYQLGLIKSPQLRAPLCTQDMTDLNIVVEANNVANTWFKNNQ